MEQAFEALLSWWDVSGVDVPDIAKIKARPVVRKEITAKRAADPAAPTKTPIPTIPASPAATELVEKVTTLGQLKQVIADFNAGAISDHARQSVFARGNPEADIMIIGEAPGRDEDIQGKPFVGKSGQLLDKMFAAIGLNEDSLYMTNVVNWRAPGNRNPKPEEIAMCLPFIQKHIELVSPKIIVLIGGIAYSALTGQSGIMKNRGQWTSLKSGDVNIPVLPIYHPEFLLSQPALKKDAWMDLLALRNKMEVLETP